MSSYSSTELRTQDMVLPRLKFSCFHLEILPCGQESLRIWYKVKKYLPLRLEGINLSWKRLSQVEEKPTWKMHKNNTSGLPLKGSVIKNPPGNAGNTGSVPAPGRSHMQWGNQASATHRLESNFWSPCVLRPGLRNKRSLRDKKPDHRN